MRSRSFRPASGGFAHDHSHCPVLAPATLAALPSTRAIPDRGVFYVAASQPAIHSVDSLVPTRLICCPHRLDRPCRSRPRLHSRTRNRFCSRILLQITSHGMKYNITTILAVIAIIFVLLITSPARRSCRSQSSCSGWRLFSVEDLGVASKTLTCYSC